ncbi:ABC transporter permease [Bacteroidota bacterium]
MLRHYILIGLRNLRRNKFFATINIAGMAIGLTTFILISLYVQNEYDYDKHNEHFDRIYRIHPIAHMKDNDEYWMQVFFPLGQKLEDDFPEIVESVTTRPVWGEFLSSSEDRTYYEDYGYFVENSFFDIFTVEFIEGDRQNSLSEPNSIVLTETLAKKYFPDESPIGKIITSRNKYPYKVTAVIKDFPDTNFERIEYLVNIRTIETVDGWEIDVWDNWSFYTYFLLEENANHEETNQKIASYINDNRPDWPTKYTLYLHPMADFHLLPDNENKGYLIIVILYSSIGIFALLVACINFMNLTTAYSMNRAKEIGIKKVVGGRKSSLVKQFLIESILISFIAIHLAFILSELALPAFNLIVEKNLDIQYLDNWQFVVFIYLIGIISGILAGIYPSFVLSSYKPTIVLKGSNQKSGKSLLRRFLVTFQFIISSILILSTLLVLKQFNFMKNKEMGFNKDHVFYAVIQNEITDQKKDFEPLRQRLIEHSGILDASISMHVPFWGSSGTNISWEGALEGERINIRINRVSHDYISLYGIEVIQGRDFSKDIQSDHDGAVLINETALDIFGWDDPIGKKINGDEYEVIGVIKDFHRQSVYNKIDPLLLVLHDGDMSRHDMYSVRFDGNQGIPEMRNLISKELKEVHPNSIFELIILSDNMDSETLNIYQGIVETFGFFSIITIMIAAVGMFGLVAFSTKMRTKEIGIRKVHGASSKNIFLILAKEFIFLIIIANVIAWPLGTGITVIDPAAYKVGIGIWEYILTGSFVLIISFSTIFYHTRKASIESPINALRYE